MTQGVADRPFRDWYDKLTLGIGTIGLFAVAYTLIHTLNTDAQNDKDTADAISAMRNIAGEMVKDRPYLVKQTAAAENAASSAHASAASAAAQANELAKSVKVAQSGAAASASAARSAAAQANAARVVPFQGAIYTARLNAIADYARVSANLSSVLARTAILVPKEAESPVGLAAMSDADLLRAAAVSRPAINAWQEYIAVTSAALAPWSIKVDEEMAKTEGSARRAYECFRWIGSYVQGEPVPAGWWDRVRKEAAPLCDGFKHTAHRNIFDRDARMVLRVMTDELRKRDMQFVPGEPHSPMD